MRKTLNFDVVVLGAGASGLVASIVAARQNKKVALLERQARVGKKILVTGNGKCNFLNKNISSEFYNYSSRKYLDEIFKNYDVNLIRGFFKSLGVAELEKDGGRVYPHCEQASAILDLLRLENASLGVTELCELNVDKILKVGSKFKVSLENGEIICDKLIVAIGGVAGFTEGTIDNHYDVVKSLGHSVTKIYPALVPVKTKSGFEKMLKGVRSHCTVKLVADGKIVKSEQGELQFTENGLSGVCIFQISGLVGEFFKNRTVNGAKCNNLKIAIDLLPQYTKEEIIDLFLKKIQLMPNLTLSQLCIGVVHKKLGVALLKSMGIDDTSTKLASALSSAEIDFLAQKIKSWEYEPTGVMPFKNAQVTCGGVPLSQINLNSMESKKVKGLYFCGEVLDVNGLCGGYNLYWAWLSGYIAGKLN